MKVYYDYQILLSQKYGGISRYFFELASRLRGLGVEVSIDCIHNHNHYFKEQLGGCHPARGRLAGRALAFANKARALWDLRRPYDIIHPTYYDPYLLGHYSGKLVVTVHDMIHEKYIDEYPELGARDIKNKERMIRAADRVIAISESTKRDILAVYPDIDESKISVIHIGTAMRGNASEGKGPLPGVRYVLFVGSRGLYKNFDRFFQAMAPILERQSGLHIMCAGGGTFSSKELKTIEGRYRERVHQMDMDDAELANAYAHAECFVFPSRYEGFGIPILEAFANGCPVVLSRSSSMPEVAGDGAEYFDPLDAEEMSERIGRVLEDGSIRALLRARGKERLKKFDWDDIAARTLECYRRTIERT